MSYKQYHDVFQGFLAEGSVENRDLKAYSHNGVVTLYHYTRTKGESFTTNPSSPRGSYSRNEYETADTPRTFFYLNPAQKERFFSSSALYKVDVPLSDIYDIPMDPRGLRSKHRHPTMGFSVKGPGGGIQNLLEEIRESYAGAFYQVGFDVVVMFQPANMELVGKEEQRSLEMEKL